MALFEYAMVMVSIVLALGVAQLLGGISELVRSPHAYLAHTFWVLALFFYHVLLWWAMWDLRRIDNWTFLAFMYLILGPTLLFFATNLLLPRTATESTDWETHFFSVRLWFFMAMTATVIWGISVTWLVGNVPLNHPYRIAQLGRLLFFVAGMITVKKRVQIWIAIGYVVYFLATALIFRLLPTLSPG